MLYIVYDLESDDECDDVYAFKNVPLVQQNHAGMVALIKEYHGVEILGCSYIGVREDSVVDAGTP